VQIAAAEGRAEPFLGTLDYAALLPKFKKLGYAGAFGCEYRPTGKTEDSLSWRNDILSKAV
jgi:hydroxypyruvate isomerase